VRSRFLRTLPREEVEFDSAVPADSRSKPASFAPTGRLPDDIEEWHVGSLVRHPQHGLGQITVLRKASRHTLVCVAFPDGEERSWILEFADLKRVEFDEVE
jgi:hypothetical protein